MLGRVFAQHEDSYADSWNCGTPVSPGTEEMAQIAGVPIGTIKSQVWQARQRVTHAISVSVTGRDRVSTKTASYPRMAKNCNVVSSCPE